MDKSDESNPKSLIIIGIVVILIGLNTLVSAIKTQTWRETKGIIISSKIVDSSDWLDIDIKYKYSVNGESYIGNRISYGDQTERSYSTIKKLSEKFPVSAKYVVVYHNPNNPQKSVLENRIDFGSLWPLIMGIFLTVCGIFDLKKEATSCEKGI